MYGKYLHAADKNDINELVYTHRLAQEKGLFRIKSCTKKTSKQIWPFPVRFSPGYTVSSQSICWLGSLKRSILCLLDSLTKRISSLTEETSITQVGLLCCVLAAGAFQLRLLFLVPFDSVSLIRHTLKNQLNWMKGGGFSVFFSSNLSALKYFFSMHLIKSLNLNEEATQRWKFQETQI